jgi:intraflagellar transport protein 122
MEKWQDALLLGKTDPKLLEIVKLPYANWLSKQDRYDEALKAYKNVGRHDLTTNLLKNLTKNAVEEKRFDDASYYYWILATENLKLVKNARQPKG